MKSKSDTTKQPLEEKYICNGKTFSSYDDVVEYCKLNNWRVANTETIRKGTYLITVNSL